MNRTYELKGLDPKSDDYKGLKLFCEDKYKKLFIKEGKVFTNSLNVKAMYEISKEEISEDTLMEEGCIKLSFDSQKDDISSEGTLGICIKFCADSKCGC